MPAHIIKQFKKKKIKLKFETYANSRRERHRDKYELIVVIILCNFSTLHTLFNEISAIKNWKIVGVAKALLN